MFQYIKQSVVRQMEHDILERNAALLPQPFVFLIIPIAWFHGANISPCVHYGNIHLCVISRNRCWTAHPFRVEGGELSSGAGAPVVDSHARWEPAPVGVPTVLDRVIQQALAQV